jgi:cytochrome P450
MARDPINVLIPELDGIIKSSAQHDLEQNALAFRKVLEDTIDKNELGNCICTTLKGLDTYSSNRPMLIDECFAIILGGIQGPSKPLTNLFYYLSMYPNIEAKLRAEINSSYPNKDLPYLVYCFNESLRLNASEGVDRYVLNDCIIEGASGCYSLKKG